MRCQRLLVVLCFLLVTLWSTDAVKIHQRGGRTRERLERNTQQAHHEKAHSTKKQSAQNEAKVIYKEARSNVVKKADLDPKYANVPVILKKTDDHPLPKAAPSMKHKPLIIDWTKEDAKPYDGDDQEKTVVTEHTTVVVEGVRKIDNDDEDDNTPLSIEKDLDETTPGTAEANAAYPAAAGQGQGEPAASDAATAVLKSKMVETLGKLSAVLEQFQHRQDQDEAALNQVKAELLKMDAVREAAKLIAKEEAEAVFEKFKEQAHEDAAKLVENHREEVNQAIDKLRPSEPSPAPVSPPAAESSAPAATTPAPSSSSAPSSDDKAAAAPAAAPAPATDAPAPVTSPAAEAAMFAEILSESEAGSASEVDLDEESPEFDKLQSTSEAILEKVSSVDREVTALADPHSANTKSLADLQALEGRLDSLLKRQYELEQSHKEVTNVVNDDLEGHTPADEVLKDAAAAIHENSKDLDDD